MKRKHDEANVIRSLMKKRGEIKVDAITKTIEVVKNASSVGIRTWGKIDYLVHYCGYHQIFVKNVGKTTAMDSVRNEFVAKINVGNRLYSQSKHENDNYSTKPELASKVKKILKMRKL